MSDEIVNLTVIMRNGTNAPCNGFTLRSTEEAAKEIRDVFVQGRVPEYLSADPLEGRGFGIRGAEIIAVFWSPVDESEKWKD